MSPSPWTGSDLSASAAGAIATRLAGTPGGRIFRMRGQGMPSLYGHGRGDLLICAQIEVPRRVGGRQKELLTELLALEEESGSSQRKGFMNKVRELFD